MKPLVVSLVKRNAIVCLASILALGGLSLVPREYTPSWIFIPFAFFCGVLWANSILIKQGHPILAVVLTLILVPVMSVPVGILSIPVRRILANRDYVARGYQMMEGCDGSAAGSADAQVYHIKNLLEDATNSPSPDTNLISDLNKGYVLAQEKAKVLGDYCGKAGHVDIHPWKTNWAEINEIIKRSEAKVYQ